MVCLGQDAQEMPMLLNAIMILNFEATWIQQQNSSFASKGFFLFF